MADEDCYAAAEAAALSGLSLPMVNYLCRAQLLEPSGRSPRGRGRRRAYTFGDVVVLRALAKLLNAGVSVANLKRSLRDLRKYHPEITPNGVPSTFLVSDGEKVYFRKKKDALESLDGTGQFAFGFVLELRRVRNEVLELHQRERVRKAGGVR